MQSACENGNDELPLLLEQLRHKLLDLTSHNKLLNFQHRDSNCLRAVDELPDQLYRRLYDGKKLFFEPVPLPSVRELSDYSTLDNRMPRVGAMVKTLQRPPADEWAQHLGISARYELPVDTADARQPKHDDDRIQTLLYPDSLATRLRKLQGDAQTAIEESGVNMLYLAFGFLDWREPAKQDKACLAPLMLVPVELRKEGTKDGTFRYFVAWTGEDLQTNLSLQKKLLQDFHLSLPDLDDEDRPEAYFDRVRDMVRGRSGWGVRRFVTLTLFSFGKQLIYLDLDPARWANRARDDGTERGLSGHPLVRRLLLGDDAGSSSGNGEELPSDARVIDLDLALVDRADSTQAAALIGALTGRSMVIQGPPGTGKSQTITNLIAAALAAKKTILFVSEKLAALEVVKRRLDEMGFGPFCLELHSHKTRKQALYDSLRERLALRASRLPESLERIRGNLMIKRDELTDYVAQIREPVGALGWSASRILFKAGDARRKAGALAHVVKVSKNFNALDVDEDGYERARRRLAALADAADVLACHPIDHSWSGVSSEKVLELDLHDVVAAGRRWEKTLRDLDDALCMLRRVIDVGQLSDDALYASARIACDSIDVLAAVDDAFSTAADLIAQVRPILGCRFGNGIGEGIQAVRRLHAIVRLAAAAPHKSLANRCEELRHVDAEAALSKLALIVKGAREVRESLEKTFRLDKAAAEGLTADAARAAAVSLRSGWTFGMFTTRGRKARGLAREYSRIDGRRTNPEEFEDYAVFCEIEKELADDTGLRRAAGLAFNGLDTDVAGLMACRNWYLALQDCFKSSLEAQVGQAMWEADRAAIDFLARLADHPDWPAVEYLWNFASEQKVDEKSLRDPAALWVAVLAAGCGQQLADAVVKARPAVGWSRIKETLQAVVETRQSADRAEAAFRDATGLDESRWWRSVQPESVHDRLGRIQRALAEPDALATWLAFDRAAREVTMSEMEAATDIARQAIAGQLPFDRLVDLCDHVLFDALARAVFAMRPIVKKLASKQHKQIRDHYRSLDEQVMELRRARIAHDLAQRFVPPGRSGAKVGDFTNLELIKREIGKKKRHLPIRKLVGRAGLALQALKPCFMMGPMSVAQFLPPEELSFDLVIFDEASQVRPEDAIGAIARGRQVVVVGDGNQLPPTNFFQRLNIDEVDDDGAADDDGSDGLGVGAIAESILDLAESRFSRKRLLWHYRSAHESLIAFSNRSFYESSLLIYPSPARTDPRLGIEFHPIGNGVFDKGRNRAEAERIAEAAAAFLRDHSERSLGVVAMNVEQTSLIRELVEERMRDDSAVLIRAEDYEQQSEPFFIKNLENVQGDERDVIMISMTYGPASEGGRVMQRFGPINQEDGWRRLNVLFTRAKERMEIFSSMRASDVLVSDKPSRGVRTLRSFLEYAETGRLEPQVGLIGTRPPDSEFEVAVRDGLRSLGYDCDVQVGASGYFIDLAVRDPEQPGRYLLGIECDGAAYHSTPSARDRDRLRQDILEDNLGWVIERVWSTDWFRDPDATLDRLRRRIEDLRASSRSLPALTEEVDVKEAETDIESVIALAPTVEIPELVTTDGVALLEKQSYTPTVNVKTASPPPISLETARRLLVDLREHEIKAAFPNSDPAHGLLRKSMIDAFIRMKPTTVEEFRVSIPLDLREKTDGEQLRAFGDKVFSVLEQIRRA